MADDAFDRSKWSEEEREDTRLAEIFITNLPSPNTPSGTDRAVILHYLDSEPSLTNFRKNGLEKFLSNIGVMPDGRVICTITQPLDERRPLFPLVWGSRFGACIRFMIRTTKIPIQAVFIPGEKSFDALRSSRVVLVSY